MTPTISKLLTVGSDLFDIHGYQRSDGSVVNLRVRFLEPGGYKRLAQESLECLAKFGDLLDHADPQAVAREAVVASLRKSLGEPSEEGAPKRVSHETFEPLSRNLSLLDGNPGKLVAFNLEVIDTEVLVQPAKVVKSSEATLVKKRLMESLPVGRYCHRLNLYDGKFDSVE